MNIGELYKTIRNHTEIMELNPPTNRKDIEMFEKNNHIKLPTEIVEMLELFNGGELFVPGTVVFGIDEDNQKRNLKYINRGEFRKKMKIPNSYLIFARLNYGDLICINLNAPFNIIQWDHELDEEYCVWDSVEEWLNEIISNYEGFEGGDK